MIQSFRHKGIKLLYENDDRSKLQAGQVDKIARIIARLDQAEHPNDMAMPGYRLHQLKGEWAGFWSVRVTGNWRIIFRFEGQFEVMHVCDVDLLDYH